LHLKNHANEIWGENHENGVKIVIRTPRRVSREQQKKNKKVKTPEKHTISLKKKKKITPLFRWKKYKMKFRTLETLPEVPKKTSKISKSWRRASPNP
jgi:hypothetical protein